LVARAKDILVDVRILKLYVNGQSAAAGRAIANLRRICREELAGTFQVEVIDVVERPDLAEEDKILATPTIVKALPPPIRRVIGDLSDSSKVLVGLDLVSVRQSGNADG
jgi:circadian clock protein KaiB